LPCILCPANNNLIIDVWNAKKLMPSTTNNRRK